MVSCLETPPPVRFARGCAGLRVHAYVGWLDAVVTGGACRPSLVSSSDPRSIPAFFLFCLFIFLKFLKSCNSHGNEITKKCFFVLEEIAQDQIATVDFYFLFWKIVFSTPLHTRWGSKSQPGDRGP